jgi:CRP-like cAMP-binding protein
MDVNHIQEQNSFERLNEILPFDISSSAFKDFTEQASIIKLVRGDTLVYEREKQQKIYYILEGSCIRYAINQQGEEWAVMFHTENFIPVLSSMYVNSADSLVSYLIKANENTFAFELNKAFGLKWFAKDPAFAAFIYQRGIQYLSIMNQIQNHLLGLSSEDFLQWLIKKYGFMFQRFRSKDIANFMGVTPI